MCMLRGAGARDVFPPNSGEILKGPKEVHLGCPVQIPAAARQLPKRSDMASSACAPLLRKPPRIAAEAARSVVQSEYLNRAWAPSLHETHILSTIMSRLMRGAGIGHT